MVARRRERPGPAGCARGEQIRRAPRRAGARLDPSETQEVAYASSCRTSQVKAHARVNKPRLMFLNKEVPYPLGYRGTGAPGGIRTRVSSFACKACSAGREKKLHVRVSGARA